MSKNSGFTLIELLVVIAIIAILAAILFPVFARAKEQANKATCSSNLHQVAIAIQMYSDNTNGVYPRGEFWDMSRPYTESYLWSSALCIGPYVKEPGIYRCPTDSFGSRDDSAYGFRAPRKPAASSYLANCATPAANYTMFGIREPKGLMPLMDIRFGDTPTPSTKSSSVTRPSEIVMIAEGKYEYYDKMWQCGLWLNNEIDWCYNAAGAGISADWQIKALVYAPDSAPWSRAWRKHGSGTNFLMSDGHVKMLPPGQVDNPKYWLCNAPEL